MKKIVSLLFACILVSGCYAPSFTHDEETASLIGDQVYVSVIYGYDTNGIAVYNEAYTISYDFSHRVQRISYIYQQGETGKQENLEILHDENGNYTGYNGEISGDMEFVDYLIAVFNIEHLHEIETNDLPYDIDLSRLHRKENEFIRIDAFCEHMILNPQISEISRIRRSAVYDQEKNTTEYYKTVYYFDQEGTEKDYLWNGKQWEDYGKDDQDGAGK